MLFAMLQEQHMKQITQMEATNKASMEAMMDKMNALVASNATRKTHPTGQGEHSSGWQRHTPWRQASEETQEEEDALPQL